MALSSEDRRHLTRAVQLGRQGWGRVHPNPMVGCVLVRDGQVVGEGWHQEWGGPHAEVQALAAAGPEAARGATAYVSLEPCRHEGKTPPCTRALEAAGVRRVVYGAADPGAESGGGGAELARAGLQVEGPVFSADEARRENPGFFHRDPARPWICLKLALSLDGRIAAAAGERTPVTGPEVARAVHHLRAGMDAVLVGARTARVDDPLLTVRGEGVCPRTPPVRVVLDGRGTLSPEARLVMGVPEGPVHLLTTGASRARWRDGMAERGVRVTVVPGREGRIAVAPALHVLRESGIRTLLCEGGGQVAGAFLGEGVVDRLHLAVAPRFFGHGGVPGFPVTSVAFEVGALRGGRSLFGRAGVPPRQWNRIEPPEALGSDVWLTYEPVRGS